MKVLIIFIGATISAFYLTFFEIKTPYEISWLNLSISLEQIIIVTGYWILGLIIGAILQEYEKRN